MSMPISASGHAAAQALAAHGKSASSPAHMARAADPSAKGAAFGALVAANAKAKHAAPPAPPTPPAPAPPPAVVEPPAPTTNTAAAPAGSVVDVQA